MEDGVPKREVYQAFGEKGNGGEHTFPILVLHHFNLSRLQPGTCQQAFFRILGLSAALFPFVVLFLPNQVLLTS